MQHANIILPKTSDPVNPQNLGAAKSPDPTIRDRSAKQRALPVDKPARPFVSRCFEVKLPCVSKMVYIALAHRCKVWTDGTEDDVRISRKQIAADAGLSIRKLKLQIASLVDLELVTVKRTGRTNIYTVRIPAAALVRSNVLQVREPDDPEPWKADGVSRATWYRDRARTEPKTTHGGVRGVVSSETEVSSETHRSPLQTLGLSLSSGTPNRKGCGSSAVSPPKNGGLFSSETDGPTGGPSEDPTGGPSTEGGSVGSTTPPISPCSSDTRRRVRNCPQCHAYDRGAEDTCQHCDWSREAWDARATDGGTA